MTKSMLPYNKLCNVEDFAYVWQDLRDIFRHIENPRLYRKYLEQVMQVRGLRDWGAWGKEAWILGIGAGVEVTNYYLTEHVAMVLATDLYTAPGWDDYAPFDAPLRPDKYAPYPHRHDRLKIQDMDARRLPIEDNTYEGIYSASSIEHFGTPQEIATALREMGRVLAPGGIMAFTTEFDIHGRSGALSENTFIFNDESLNEYVIGPSGCVPVDTPDREVSETTRYTSMDLNKVIELAKQDAVPSPHIVIKAGGYEFLPVSIVLRKPDERETEET